MKLEIYNTRILKVADKTAEGIAKSMAIAAKSNQNPEHIPKLVLTDETRYYNHGRDEEHYKDIGISYQVRKPQSEIDEYVRRYKNTLISTTIHQARMARDAAQRKLDSAIAEFKELEELYPDIKSCYTFEE